MGNAVYYPALDFKQGVSLLNGSQDNPSLGLVAAVGQAGDPELKKMMGYRKYVGSEKSDGDNEGG